MHFYEIWRIKVGVFSAPKVKICSESENASYANCRTIETFVEHGRKWRNYYNYCFQNKTRLINGSF